MKDNLKSKVLFEEKLAFNVEKFQEWSGEWILNKKVDDEMIQSLEQEMDYLKEEWIEWDGIESEEN